MDNIDTRMRNIIDRWYEDNEGFCESKIELKNLLDKWLEKAEQDERETLLELFAHSKFFSKRKVNNIFLDFYHQLEDEQYSIFTAVESQEVRQNSSYIYLNEFAIVSNVTEYSIIPTLRVFSQENMEYIRQIIFIDDIIGTGETVVDFFETIKSIIAKKKIFLWVICITEFARKKIEEYSQDNKMEIEICAYRVERKAFEGGYIFDVQEAGERERMIASLETKLWKKPSKYILGRDNAQCLLSFYNDTPNNTLSSFWFCNGEWTPVFQRKKKEKPEWLKDKKRKRIKENYEHSR